MTVNCTIDGIAVTVSGVKHREGFEAHSVHLFGYGRDVKKILAVDFIERIQEAAFEAAESEIPFQSAHQVDDALSVVRAEGGRE